MRYQELRPRIRTGDLILYPRVTLADVRAGRAALLTWAGNLEIALRQRRVNSRNDGCWELIHVEMAVVNRHPVEVLAAGWTAGQRGPGLQQLSKHLAAYPKPPLYLPLYEHVTVQEEDMQRWLDLHRLDEYNYAGLLFPASARLTGWVRPGRMFCSEAAISMLQGCGALPKTQRIWAGDHVAEAPIQPQQFSPDEVAALRRILDWDSATEIES